MGHLLYIGPPTEPYPFSPLYCTSFKMGLKLMFLLLGLMVLASAKSYTCSPQSTCDNIVSLVYDKFRNTSGPVKITFNVSKETSKLAVLAWLSRCYMLMPYTCMCGGIQYPASITTVHTRGSVRMPTATYTHAHIHAHTHAHKIKILFWVMCPSPSSLRSLFLNYYYYYFNLYF